MSVTSDEHDRRAERWQAAARRSTCRRCAPASRTQRGKQYWRSLEELADTQEFQAYLEAEFPEQAPHVLDPVGRRTFLKLMGASLALAGVSACTRQPTEKVFPYVKAPEQIVPGEPLFFATAMPLGGIAHRPAGREPHGPPDQGRRQPRSSRPASAPPTCSAQASVLGLYDPDRSQVVRYVGEVQTLGATSPPRSTRAARRSRSDTAGAGTAHPHRRRSPRRPWRAQMRELLAAVPAGDLAPVRAGDRDNARAAARTRLRAAARRRSTASTGPIASCRSTPTSSAAGRAGALRRATSSRKPHVDAGGGSMNRLYVVETVAHRTPARMADHRLPLRPAEIAEFALGRRARRSACPVRAPVGMEAHAALIDRRGARPAGSTRAAASSSPATGSRPSCTCWRTAINTALGNDGDDRASTPSRSRHRPVDQTAVAARSGRRRWTPGRSRCWCIARRQPRLRRARRPASSPTALAKVPTRVHHGLYYDETAELCHWHLPATHYLEDRGATRAPTTAPPASMQPLIAPLYDGRSAARSARRVLLGQRRRDQLRPGARLPGRTRLQPATSRQAWRKVVHDGVDPRHALPAVQPNWVSQAGDWSKTLLPPPRRAPAGALDVVFRPDSDALRRPLRQQRLAAGGAQAHHHASPGTTRR